MIYCTGTTPSQTPGFNYKHACKLERGHEGGCVCIGCGNTFDPIPALPRARQARMVLPEEIDPVRSLLPRDYLRWKP